MLVRCIMLLPLFFGSCLALAEATIDGRWHGHVDLNDGGRIESVLEAEEVGDSWVLRMTQAEENRFHQPILESEIDGSKITFGLIVADDVQTWSGELADGQSALKGKVMVGDDALGTFHLAHRPRAQGHASTTTWSGSAIVPGRDFETIQLHLAQLGEHWIGDVDLPDRRISNHPIEVTQAGTSLNLDLPLGIQIRLISPTSLDDPASPQQVMAIWEEGAISSTLVLRRQVGDAPLAEPTRPQSPRATVSYQLSQAVIEHPIGHLLGATLATPLGDGPFPAVVLVAGIGNRDRDDRFQGHRFQAVWADALARRGIASVRFDDRGVGESTMPQGSDVFERSIRNETIDVRYLVEWLSSQPGIDPGGVGIIGWGDGGFVAMNAAAGLSREVSYIALLSTPGVRLGEIAKGQIYRELASIPVDPDRIRAALTAHGTLMDVLLDPEASEEEVRELVERYLLARQRMLPGEDKPVPTTAINEAMLIYASEEARRNYRFNPVMILPRLRCPVLALGSDADHVTPAGVHLPLIEAAVQRTGGEVDLVEITGLNHRLQPVNPDQRRRVDQIRATVDPRALRAVTDWIHTIVGTPLPEQEVDQP